jgi:predicted phage terminase large subunit-like protein
MSSPAPHNFSPAELRAAEEFAAQHSFRLFAKLMHQELFPGIPWQETMLHLRIFEFLHRAFIEPDFRGCINIPPRAGKTHLVCMWISWCYGKHPDSNFIYATSTAGLSETSAILVRKMIDTPLYKRVFPETRLNEDVNAKDKFEIERGGAMLARGIDGQITGFGAGITQLARYRFGGALIADDLHKVKEARSEAAKNGVRVFVTETFNTRVNDPRTPKIYIGQRVAPDDIFALLCPSDGATEPLTGEKYETLRLTPIDDNGESIWENKWPTKWCHALRKAQPWLWATQYMQQPYNLSGTIFQVDMMPVLHTRPPGPALYCRAWDLAATESKQGRSEPDQTAKALIGYYPSVGMYLIEDAAMYRSPPNIVRADIRNTAKRDGLEVTIHMPQDPGQAGKAQAQDMVAMLPEYKVKVERMTGDKVARAEPMAAHLNVGLVGVLAPYAELVKSQLRPFPDAAHDDLVDALADAYNQLAIPDEDELARIRAIQAYENAAKFNFGPGGERTAIEPGESPYGPGYEPGEEPV